MELMAEKSIGRNKLARYLGVGEGVIRTIIGRLKDAGLVATSKGGCNLTSKGLALWKDYKSIFRKRVEIGKNEFTLSACNFAFLIKDCGHKVKSGMEQRDAAIRAGAKATTTVICKGGFLVIPFVTNNVAKDFPIAGNQIVKLLKPEENDVIIIAGADTSIKARHGAFAAAWALFD
jgi:predicted transcriptional regulator